MNRTIVKAAAALAALAALSPAAQAQYRSYYYSSSSVTFTPPPGVPVPPGPTPVVLYGSGIGAPVNYYGARDNVYYARLCYAFPKTRPNS